MNEEATLLVVENVNNGGYAEAIKTEFPIYVREKSVTRSEFYEALRSDIRIRLVLEARTEDWELSAHIVDSKKEYASQVEYEGSTYDIVRTYKENSYIIEIVCS